MTKKPTKVELTQSALSDLESIAIYYEDQGVPKVGRRFMVEIIEKIERLKQHPESGRIVPEFGVAHIKEIIFPPFRIVYQNTSGCIWVLRVWRSERLMVKSILPS